MIFQCLDTLKKEFRRSPNDWKCGFPLFSLCERKGYNSYHSKENMNLDLESVYAGISPPQKHAFSKKNKNERLEAVFQPP